MASVDTRKIELTEEDIENNKQRFISLLDIFLQLLIHSVLSDFLLDYSYWISYYRLKKWVFCRVQPYGSIG